MTEAVEGSVPGKVFEYGLYGDPKQSGPGGIRFMMNETHLGSWRGPKGLWGKS